MAAVTVCRYTGGRLLGGWCPLLCVLLGSLVVVLMPLVREEDQCCAALRGLSLLRCRLGGGSQRPAAVQTTSLTVPFTAMDVLPLRSKPSNEMKLEAKAALQLALEMRKLGKREKAHKLLVHALSMNPDFVDALDGAGDHPGREGCGPGRPSLHQGLGHLPV
ncbi:hypothetical protein KUCAC02_029133 [Chaenocephalus aceratus]|uniref:Uncharacterized protein n=1 Tax=Chaenocephalus aceratus TaxID=36190 RepID=A0ACB9X3W6_CHAAC|nr:hypothetical protein KUCAC02_029133 [Chaenocephalus aceratus]